MSSQTSGVRGGDLGCVADQHAVSDLDMFGQEATSSEWTDEKHSSYLRSMEASFVHQLYNSIEASGLQSHTRSRNQSDTNSAGQYKVHRNGYWQRIKVGRSEPHPQLTEDRQFLLRNPWIQHFKAKSRENKTVQDNASIEGQPMGGRGRTMYTCGFGNITEHSPNAQAYQDSIISREFSGQNFDDEDNGGGTGQVG
ncbi:hypothetical protein RND81_02G054400 [Saponaria officinalis]|uniref:Uncharacterized protein n=1 Tax=Saponaria officinalis TaxID=3572 RepID=A0AAW1MN85_SAPOF